MLLQPGSYLMQCCPVLKCLALAGAVALGACGDAPQSPILEPEANESTLAPLYLADPSVAVAGRFMVVVDAPAYGEAVSLDHGLDVSSRFTRLLSGFVTDLDSDGLRRLRADPRVRYIEQDQVAHAHAITQDIPADGAWGLDRIDQRDRGLSGTYRYGLKGSGVNVYLVDSGIDTDHPQFIRNSGENRIQLAAYYEEAGDTGEDCAGHGTHVAGTIAGKTYGVAKLANIYSIRVLDCDGNGLYSVMINALEWIAENSNPPAVINISMGGGLSKSMN